MSRRVIYQWMVGLGFLCLIILFLQQKHHKLLEPQMKPMSTTLNETTKNIELNIPLSEVVKIIVDQERIKIRNDMKDYEYPNGKYNINANKLEDLVLEENGRPIRSIILTTWRSGSTFFSDAINAHPGTFFFQEPLEDFGIVQIRGPPIDTEAIERVKRLFNCEYKSLDHYTEFVQNHNWAFHYNEDTWQRCQSYKTLCYNHDYLSSMCKLFPFQLMKLVRLSLNVAQELLADKKLAVRIVLLVRDPRGTIQSRKHREWCPPSRDCSDVALLCSDLASDYKVAVELLKKYPNTFKVIRYEDLAVEPYEHIKEVSEFYGIDFHKDMKQFLNTHTTRNSGGVSSTFRDSKTAPFHWRTELKFEEVNTIQRSCAIAMERWGYLQAMNATDLIQFHPITDYVLN